MPMYETYGYSIGIGHDGTIAGSSNATGNTLTAWSYEGGRYGFGEMTDIPDTQQADRLTVRGVSNDGEVIVGSKASSVLYWKRGVGYQAIGSGDGAAYGVSSDGSVVTGWINKATAGQYEAFRWQASGLTLLPMPGDTVSSQAYGISADGSVIAGTLRGDAPTSLQAFRWKDGTTTALGNPSTKPYYVMGVGGISGDGNVIVGYGQTGTIGNNQLAIQDAFRWAEGTGFQFLPKMAGFEQIVANAANFDGSVIVGAASDVDYSELVQHRGWRWAADSGMQSIEQWLTANGVAPGEGFHTSAATGVSGDGSVVVGNLKDGNKFIARVCNTDGCTGSIHGGGNASGGGSSGGGSSTGGSSGSPRPGTGAITLNGLQQSVGAAVAGGTMAMTTTTTTFNGAHSRPLANRVAIGKSTFWASGDLGADKHDSRDGTFGLAEIGYGHNFGPVQLNVSVGRFWGQQDFDYGGYAKNKGSYLMLEGLTPITDNGLVGVLSLYGQYGENSIKRAYRNAGNSDSSSGDPGVSAWGIRGRLQWDALWQVSRLGLSPYLDLSYSESSLDGYTESGGGFPVRFDSRRDTATELRIGLEAKAPLTHNLRLIAILEGAHRFESKGGDVTGEVIGLFPFAIEGPQNKKSWLRGVAGVEGDILTGTGSLLLNTTTSGSAPSAWVAVNWRKTF